MFQQLLNCYLLDILSSGHRPSIDPIDASKTHRFGKHITLNNLFIPFIYTGLGFRPHRMMNKHFTISVRKELQERSSSFVFNVVDLDGKTTGVLSLYLLSKF